MSANPPTPSPTPSPASSPASSPAPPTSSLAPVGTSSIPSAVVDPDARLKTQKLELEIDQLKRARENLILERLKTVGATLAGLVALCTLFWTVNAGVKQLTQAQNGQDQDRFDKALTRLGSASVRERLTGASGLSLFLTSDQKSRHAATLRFLASALVIEDDPNVRQAILGTFSRIDPEVVPETARRDGLQTLLSLNRSARVAYLQARAAPQASGKDAKAALDNRTEAIRASARAIVIFVKMGTAERDFSGIDCADCYLSSSPSPLDLSGTDFHGAVLTNANFSGTKLIQSSFAGADLSGADFEGADLERAAFTDRPDDSFTLRNFVETGRRPEPPNFACANAAEADFSGSLLLGVIESRDPSERIAGIPDFFKTDVRGAKLSQAGIYALALRKSKSPAPFKQTKINTYQTRAAAGSYQTMHIAESSGWQFAPSSRSFKQSFQYLLTNLQSARNMDKAYLPAPLSDYRNVPAPAYDPTLLKRCDKYANAQGQ